MYTNNMYDEFMCSTCDIPLFNESSTIICNDYDSNTATDTFHNYNINANNNNNIDGDDNTTNNNVNKSVSTLDHKNINM